MEKPEVFTSPTAPASQGPCAAPGLHGKEECVRVCVWHPVKIADS